MIDLKKTFIENLLFHSIEKDNFDLASTEWKLKNIHYTNYKGYDCICHHRNIKKLCIIQNKYNHKKLIIGSDCIGRFLKHIEIKFYFLGINSLKNNGIPNHKFIDFLFNNRIISEYVFKFYYNLYNKKKLTEKQINFKTKINKETLNKVLSQKIEVE